MNAVTKFNDQAKFLIEDISDDLRVVLPSNIPYERFKATFITAVANNLDILTCDQQSVKTALMKAATDKLLPDNREAAIVPYNTKVKDAEGRERWLKLAQYMPMVQGIRKRALELGGVRISAECVYQNDFFDAVLGDNPHIEHKPTKLGQPRGDIIGAYAIFKLGDEIVHRELMPKEDIETARSVSKAKDGPGWTKFYGEFARKTVVRRGSKSIPSMAEELRTIIEREDEFVDFHAIPTEANENHNPLIEPSQQQQIAHNPGIVMTPVEGHQAETVPMRASAQAPQAQRAARKTNTGSEEQRGGDVKPTSDARQGNEPMASAKPAETSAGGAASDHNDRPPQNSATGIRKFSLNSDEVELLKQYSDTLDATEAASQLKVMSDDFWNGKPPEQETELYAAALAVYGVHRGRLSGVSTAEQAAVELEGILR